MSRSYSALVASLIGVAGLIGVAQWVTSDEPDIVAAPVVATSPTEPTTPAVLGAVSATELTTTQLTTTELTTTELTTTTAPVVDPDCALSIRLEVGVVDPEVACLEARLIEAGLLTGVVPDEVYDELTEAAVEAFQTANALVVDGMVGPQTATVLGAWSGPDVLPPDPSTCPSEGRSAVVDRFNQRAWLCDSGSIVDEMPITSAISQPDPGEYEVYAKDLNASSNLSGEYSTMTHFVAFTYGKYQGARIAFHSIPKYSNGEFVQPLDSVGTQELFGASAGCIRVLPDDAVAIWDWLAVGDTVIVVS